MPPRGHFSSADAPSETRLAGDVRPRPLPEITGLAAIEGGRELPQGPNVLREEAPVPRLPTSEDEQAALVGGQRPGSKREAIEHRKVTERLVANLAARNEHSLFEPSHELGTIPQRPR